MATVNLNLYEFLSTEVVDVAQFNSNSTKIDNFAGKVVTTEAQVLTDDEKFLIKTKLGIVEVTVVQSEGTSTTAVMSQKAVSDLIAAEISSVYRFKGDIASVSDLNLVVDAKVGDVYYVTDDGINHAYNGTAWKPLAGSIDMTQFVTRSELPKTFVGSQAEWDALDAATQATYDFAYTSNS